MDNGTERPAPGSSGAQYGTAPPGGDEEDSASKEGTPLLEVDGLCKYFPIHGTGVLRHRAAVVRAVDDVSFRLMPGETVGLVGESGSGKTTTVRTILRALRPSRGKVLFRTNDGVQDLAQLGERRIKALRPRMQMIFQDPFSSLNPRMTAGAIVGEPLVVNRLARGSELRDRVADMLARVGLESQHAMRYPHAFSGGQRQRIGIARALILRPSLVVADEPVSALDVSVQAQVINLLMDLQQEFGVAYIFVAHDLSVVRHICDRVGVMYAGRIVEFAQTAVLFADPKHPYTKALISAVPNPDPDIGMQSVLSGEVADPADLPTGCAFHPRCVECFSPCPHIVPELNVMPDGRRVACHLHAEDARTGDGL